MIKLFRSRKSASLHPFVEIVRPSKPDPPPNARINLLNVISHAIDHIQMVHA